MRRTLTALLVVLLLALELPARSNRDWENVKKLKPGTTVEILLWSGQVLSGEIDSVTDAGLQLAPPGRHQAGLLHEVDRAAIRRIVRLHHPYLPDSRRWMLTGALAGGAVGVTAGAVADIRHGGNYHWFEGALGGAALGFLVSCAGLAAVGTVDVARLANHRKVVYEDKSNHPPHSGPLDSFQKTILILGNNT
jgi:hypothetical protein